jgi:uncharacterized protein YukJ
MPLDSYGVLVGRPVERRRESGTGTPHYQVLMRAEGADYRIAVNVRSAQAPSELRYLVVEDFAHPVLSALAGLPEGWIPVDPQPGAAALDYIRGNLLDPEHMRVLPADLPGADNDLADLLDAHVLRAMQEASARVYAFGEPWGPDPARPDSVFGFVPGRGVHNIHMNQGNDARFARDDGVWQDGALLVHYPAAARWVALFLAFQSQAWHTDDVTGHALGQTTAGRIRIVAALPNPVGGALEVETVTVLNVSPDEVGLDGWLLADRAKHRHPLPAVRLAAGEALRVFTSPPFQLGNAGGMITLLDPDGLKVHGVAYTAEQAGREGWTVVP